MFSVKPSSRIAIDIDSDSVLSALHKKTNKSSLSNTTLHQLAKITTATTDLNKYQARDIFLHDCRISSTTRSATLVSHLNSMIPLMASPVTKRQLEKFIYNCNAVTSDENFAADPLMHKAATDGSTYPDNVSEADYSSDESTGYESDSTSCSVSDWDVDDDEDISYENEVSGTLSSSKETAAKKDKTPPSDKHYSGYEENISQELQKIPAMEVSELVELVKKRDDMFLQMREKKVLLRDGNYLDKKLQGELCALLGKLGEYENVIRNQELIYEATHGKGIHFSEMNIPPRRGEHCKLIALSLLDNYFADRMGKYYVPMLKEHYYNVSLRQLAKDEGSLQGEVLESTMLKKLAEKLGYSVEMVRPESLAAFKECLQNNVQDKGIIIFYALESDDLYDIYDDRFFASLESLDAYEHASVISWYDSDRDICTLNHWQEKYPGIPVDLLYKSNQSLKATRNKEFYSVPAADIHLKKDYTDEKGERLYKYHIEHDDQHWDAKKRQNIKHLETGFPAPGTGFKGLVMLIEPDKNHCRWDPQQQYVLRRHGKNQTEWIPARKYSF